MYIDLVNVPIWQCVPVRAGGHSQIYDPELCTLHVDPYLHGFEWHGSMGISQNSPA